ncbi:hypothetical protein NDU88_001930 [Pleurodeles waltl]|uniref:Uncharacterized protein n=1 Tax=Pleurodeles waltl TaxID=8319 RepID=A0AAV7T1Q4_PLEWA|nr:hypothetical protein NDU88_001930 [Pleurodeles waltl]
MVEAAREQEKNSAGEEEVNASGEQEGNAAGEQEGNAAGEEETGPAAREEETESTAGGEEKKEAVDEKYVTYRSIDLPMVAPFFFLFPHVLALTSPEQPEPPGKRDKKENKVPD